MLRTAPTPYSESGSGGGAWFTALGRAHAIAALAVLAVCVGVYAVVAPVQPPAEFAAALVGFLFLWLPHATLDQYAARLVLKPILGWFWLPVFFLTYAMIAIGAVFVWASVPEIALAAFLALSIMHVVFGEAAFLSWRRAVENNDPAAARALIRASGEDWLLAAARGAAPFALIALFHPHVVAASVGWVISDNPTAYAIVFDWVIPAALGWQLVWALAIIQSLMRALGESDAGQGLAAAEMAAVVLAFAFLPAIIAVVLYFGLYHSFRHVAGLARLVRRGPPVRDFLLVLRATIVPTLLTVLAAWVALHMVERAGPGSEAAARLALWLVTGFATAHIVTTALLFRPPFRP